MRLDHLLSTENSVGCSSDGVRPARRMVRRWRGCWCGRCRWLCPAGRAVGAGVVRMRFWAPGSPPQAFLPGAIRCPSCLRAGRVPVRRRGGAWWLENWIVDASKARVFLDLCFAVDFESNSVVRFDRFVIIFSVMICRLGICWRNLAAHACCVCVACKGVWWMPWQTGPMKDV